MTRFIANKENGSALVYILIAIALLAALTVSFMKPSGQQTQSQNIFKVVSEIKSQVDFIRSTVQGCVITYPGGDAGVIANVDANTPTHPYPIRPSSAYYDNDCGVGESAANDNVSNLRCAGNPGDDACHADLFGGSSGKFMPAAPKLFSEWQWYNGPDGVFVWIATTKTDPYIDAVLAKLDETYGACEGDIIDASSGGAEDLDNDSVASCDAGERCFRVWFVTQRGTSLYPDEVDCNAAL